MSVARKCKGGSKESMLLHEGWRVGLQCGRDVAPLPLTTHGTHVGSARCTAAWICLHETSTAPVWTTSHCSRRSLSFLFLGAEHGSPQHSWSHVQAEARLPICITTDLIRALGFHGRKHRDNSSGSSHYFCLTGPVGLDRASRPYPFSWSFCIG